MNSFPFYHIVVKTTKLIDTSSDDPLSETNWFASISGGYYLNEL